MRRTALLALLALPPAAQAGRAYVGVAVDARTGTPLYEEHHYLRDDGERLVLYRCPAGTAFARKQVRPGADPLAPEFELEDVRFGYREGARRDGGKVSAWVQRSTAHALERGDITPAPGLVIDAGFDEFVRRHRDVLQRGESATLDFLVPSRRRTYAFAVKRLRRETVEGHAASVFKLGPSGMLGWFAPAIEVTYRDADFRLLRFSGITNVRENPDDSLSARVDFPPARERTLSAADWDDARATPLADCPIAR